jgi:hypothetical protein
MALIRVAQYSSTPTVVGDYQAQNAHLQAFTNQLLTQQFILDSGTAQPVIKQGCYVSHGGSLYVADADTAITGSPADGSVYIRVSGTTSLTVEFITSLSGYVWNPVYNAMTNGIYTLLPYMIVKAGATWTRFNFNPNNQVFGEMKATSIDTGHGANELYAMNQNVRTTDSPTFANATIAGHNIDSELDTLNGRVNQGVKTTDSPTFASINTTNGPNKPLDNNDASMPSVGIGGFSYATASVSTNGAYPSITIGSGGTWVYIAESRCSSSIRTRVGRISGGSSVQGDYDYDGATAYVTVLAWRIA